MHGGWSLVISVIIAGHIAMAAFLSLAKFPAFRSIYLPLRTRNHRKSRHADGIAEYVWRECRIRIDHQRASMIELLVGGGDFAVRLAAALSLPMPHVRRLLRRMRDDGLLGDGGLDPALRECIARVLGGEGQAR